MDQPHPRQDRQSVSVQQPTRLVSVGNSPLLVLLQITLPLPSGAQSTERSLTREYGPSRATFAVPYGAVLAP